MLRRDYILRMIEEFMQALARIQALKREQRWSEATVALDEEFAQLIGLGPQAVAKLSETELFARIVQDGPTHAVRDKTLTLATLLTEAGDVATAQEQKAEAGECYLKALNLLLEVLGQSDEFECPAYVPKIERLMTALGDTPLPVRTQVLLMQHYERSGEFGRAEDCLFDLLDADATNRAAIEFGTAFYRRLLAQPDDCLTEGNLPRVEVEEGLKKLQAR